MNIKEIQTKTLVRIIDGDDLRESAEMMLSYAGWNVSTYPDAVSFLTQDSPSFPGCTVVDIRMPGMSGPELQAEMLRRAISLPIIILTGHANVDLAVMTLKAGAFDFLQKPVDEIVLLETISKACEESLRCSLGLMCAQELKKRFNTLSAREKDVAKLIADGLTTKAIAERLGISDWTVYEHKSEIYKKLGSEDIKGVLSTQETAYSLTNRILLFTFPTYPQVGRIRN